MAPTAEMAFNLARMTLAFLVLALLYRRHWREVTRHQLLAGAIVGLFLAMGYASAHPEHVAKLIYPFPVVDILP